MSSGPKPSLHICANSLGPVASLDADLSKYAQNLIYARNGTGKSFLTRALRYLDLHADGQDIQDAPVNLIAEESINGQGVFELSRGGVNIGKLTLNSSTSQVIPEIGDCIFLVFSDDFVQAELRQSNFVVNGNIESKITLDQSIISTKDAEEKLAQAEARLEGLKRQLGQAVIKAKEDQLATKAGVNKRLREYFNIQLPDLLADHSELPDRPPRSFGDILGDLDTLKSVPAEPDYPNDIETLSFNPALFDVAGENLARITSPSSVAEEIKAKIALHPAFVETGVEIIQNGTHENCPFCEQSIAHPPARDVIAAYMAYFADAEGEHKKALREDWSRIKALRGAVSACETSFSRNSFKYESLKRLVPSQRSVVLPDLSKQVETIDSSLGVYAQAIQQKGSQPGDEVAAPKIDIASLFASLREMIVEINQAFSALRGAISASDAERRNLHREACAVFAIEFVRSSWASFESVRAHEEEVRVAAAELAALKKSQLSDNAKDRVAATFEALVISFFGHKYTFDKASFTLKHENREMMRGPSRTLSDGEKTAIAFCYFIACVHKKVKTTSDYGKIYLVFDDPITSMSYDYVFTIAQTLKHMSISSTGDISINPSDISKGYVASADVVAEIEPPTAEHYLATSKECGIRGMTADIAKFLTTVSLNAVAASVRPSRPLLSAVRQMKRAASEASKAAALPEKPSGTRLEDMAGYGAAKDWGLQLAEDLRAWKAGDISWEDVDRGALLYGPPGCGKTSYAKALAATCGVDLVLASAARWQARGHLGDYLKAMRAAFAEAKKKAPCLLFIDEFDSFGDRDAPTSDDHHRDYRRQVINGLLECLDPAEGREGVIIVGATNNPHVIDRALLRSGRLETLIGIPLPDDHARVEILRHHLKDRSIGGDLSRFISVTRGWSGADLEKLARDARRLARRQKVQVTEALLMEVMPARHVFSAAELRYTAVHEAGHAIIGVLLSCDRLTSVHIERDVPLHGSRLVVGLAQFEPDERAAKTAVYYDTRIAMLLGGIAAETLVYGCGSDSAGGDPSSDLALASDIATRLERHFGLGESLSVELGRGTRPLEYLRERDPQLRQLVDARLKAQFERAVDLLSEHRAELDRLVEMLITKYRVEGAEVRALFSSAPRKTASVRT